MAPRTRIRHRFPWTKRALRALDQLVQEQHSFRAIARKLKDRRLVGELVDPAIVRRAALRKAVR
jgi:hypothetical protein